MLFCQYKLRPWSLTVQLSPSKPPRVITADVDPNSTVGAAILQLRLKLNAPPSMMGVEQEYSLYVPELGWLEDTRKLLLYPGLAVRSRLCVMLAIANIPLWGFVHLLNSSLGDSAAAEAQARSGEVAVQRNRRGAAS